ncbi:Metallo-dependent phosphatase [Delitschia confertaspora ATCC 74209]|uniref:Metallo-dependent phosphatase n=1 Tax=Delitschia confertaspora ATCC 74209 TaxID=1513339 RepID=A0A9P4JUK6_9PLEO|nr:Metallo-dependent phosphatase [Delitschia confertaspora ATCC 74209]
MASSYQSRPDQKASTAPLIHFASNNWNDAHDLDASDEDEAFYTADDDYLIHPKWQAMAIRTKNRIPRRIQRYFFIYIVLLIVSYVAWRVYLGPQWEHNREEVRKMDAELKEVYGQNVRHEFTDTIQLKTLDRELVPGAHEGNENRRLIFIGDVHGCREELEDLLKRVDFQESDDHLIFTGDMIAKGPDSPGVISLAQKYSASCVRGNHEDRVILSITEMDAHHVPLPGPEEDPSKMNDFMDEESFSHGDFKVRKLAKQLSKEQIQYLKECPLILKVGNVEGTGEMATVHGGLIPGIPLEEQDPFQCMNMRSIDLDTHIPKEDHSATPWEKFWNHRQKKLDPAERLTVVYGHDSKRGKNIKKYSKGLDTGCVNGGKLTALVVESGKESVISVSCKNYK